MRNACVAAGCWGDPAAIAPLVRLLSDPSPIVRGHAAWALGRIGTEAARLALAAALEDESHDDVRQEIALAVIIRRDAV